MGEQQTKVRKVGDLKLSPTQQNSGVVVKRSGSGLCPDVTLAAFTTPAEMIAWLAEQYDVKSLALVEARADAVEENDAPRYQWKTREDFVVALTMALSVRGYPATTAPGEIARGLADIIDSVHAQGIGG